MPRQITVVTPENVRIEYELAGPASRAGAALIDLCLQGAILLVLITLGAVIGIRRYLPGAGWAGALIGIATFVTLWGYYAFFETIWNGQTPGKRACGLRVVREGGKPVDIVSASVRNLLRVIDFLPFMYMLGSIIVFFSPTYKRLGDFAAGTIVIKERTQESLSVAAPVMAPQPASEIYPEAAAVRNIERISNDEFEAIKRFVIRRAELQEPVREQLAGRIAAPILAQLEIEHTPDMNCSNLLTEIYNRCVTERGMR